MPKYEDVDATYQYLDMSSKNLGVDGLIDILADLADDRMIKQIDLSRNLCREDANRPESMESVMKSLCHSLETNKCLTALDCVGNHLGDYSPQGTNLHGMHYMDCFAQSLAKSTVVRLDISENLLLGDTNRKYSGLSSMVRKYASSHCKVFKLRFNSLHSQACSIIAGALHPYSRLVELDLADNTLGLDPFGDRCNEGVRNLAKCAGVCQSLKVLRLPRNFLHDEEIICIAEAIQRLHNFNLLDISGNYCTSFGVEALADAIIHHSNLKGKEGFKYLDISHNPITSYGLSHLSRALKTNNTLTYLDCSACSIKGTVFKDLAQALARNSTLLHLDLTGNAIAEKVEEALMSEIEANCCLQTLMSNPNKVDTAELSETVYTALAKKLEFLPKNVLELLHHNPSFVVPVSYMQECLYILVPPDRRQLLNLVEQKSLAVHERRNLSTNVQRRVQAARKIFFTVMRWYRVVQFQKRLGIFVSRRAKTKIGRKKSLMEQPSRSPLAKLRKAGTMIMAVNKFKTPTQQTS